MLQQVLSVIQNYENLATESSADHRQTASLDARLSVSSVTSSVTDEASAGVPRIKPARKSMRQLHLPPVASEVMTFKESTQLKSVDEDDEGIKYVDQLQVRRDGSMGSSIPACTA